MSKVNMSTLMRLALFASLLLPTFAWANCISPLITPRECDFKNEDTNLWLYQPPLKWTSDEKVDTAIESGKEFADQYLNSVKMTGDQAMQYLYAGKAAAQQAVIAIQTTQALIAQGSNDPWNLKTIYTDLICSVFYAGVQAATGTRTGDCNFNYIAAAQTIQDNLDTVQKIRDIANNPYLILGEEWGEVADDMDRVMAEYNELETMARNLTGPQMQAKLDEKFKTFQQQLINPIDPVTHKQIVRPEIDKALENTIRDILMGTQANAKNLYGARAINDNDPNYVFDPTNLAEIYKSDLEESQGVEYKNHFAVGRMQATEIKNMANSLQGQALLDITEQYMTLGYMSGLDMQSELEMENQNTAYGERFNAELQTPQNELRIGDGVPVGIRPAGQWQ